MTEKDLTTLRRRFLVALALRRAGYCVRRGWLDAGGTLVPHGLCVEPRSLKDGEP